MTKDNNHGDQKRVPIITADNLPKEGYLNLGVPCHNIGLLRAVYNARDRCVVLSCAECGEPYGALALESKIKPINRGLILP